MLRQSCPVLVHGFLNHESTIKGLSPKTIEEYQKDLYFFLKYLLLIKGSYDKIEDISDKEMNENISDEDILNVDRDTIYGFLYYLDEDRHASVPTRRRKLASINSFYTHLKFEEKLINEIPSEKIPQPKLPKRNPVTLSTNEVDQLMFAVRKHSRFAERDLCIFTFLFHLGLRREEAVSIDLHHIKDFREIHIYGKGDKERIIPLDEACVTALKNYIPKRLTPKDDEDINALFTSRNRRRMTASNLYKLIKKTVKEASLDGSISPHTCRHTFATLLLDNSNDIVTLQELMGHESILTTNKYIHLKNKKHAEMIMNNPLNDAYQREFENMEKEIK